MLFFMVDNKRILKILIRKGNILERMISKLRFRIEKTNSLASETIAVLLR